MVDELGFRSLLVMTDDSEALATVKNITSTWGDGGVTAVASLDEPEFSRTMFDPRKDNALMMYSGEKNACDLAVVSFLNILLAGQADGFVGTYNSNFGARSVAFHRVALHWLFCRLSSCVVSYPSPPHVLKSRFIRPHGSAPPVCHAWVHDPHGVAGQVLYHGGRGQLLQRHHVYATPHATLLKITRTINRQKKDFFSQITQLHQALGIERHHKARLESGLTPFLPA
jgi:hypothetical protein